MRAIPSLALLLCLAVAPAASAWSLAPPADLPLIGPADEALGMVQGAAACALGDVDLDGKADLLLRTVDAAGKVRLEALAGPHFQHAIWHQVISAQALLDCAPDLGADRIADPVLRLAGQVTATLPNGQQQVQVVLQTLDGASGAIAVTRSVTESVTGAAATGVGAVQQVATGTLVPAASGALAQITMTATGATALLPPLPVPGGLPIPSLGGVEAAASAALTLVDSAGRVVGTVTLDTPGVDPLALAAIPAGALPQVAALTSRAVSQVEGLAAQVPTLSLYSPDGVLLWATDLAASTGVPVLMPRPGDLDLDGVPDMLVETVSGTVDGVAGAAFTAVSGLDGHILFETQAVAGWAVAIPLGALPQATALLQAAQATAEGALKLSALDGAGSVLWVVDVAADAFPTNLALDAFTGDLTGFTDLTGDAIPDVGVGVLVNGSVDLSVIDGLTGKVVWAMSLADASTVMAVASHASSLATAHASQTLADAAGQASSLLAIGGEAGNLVLTKVQGLQGQVEWTAKAVLAEGQGLLDIQSAGDLDLDGVADLLLTVGPVVAAAEAAAAGAASTVPQALDSAQVYAISTVTGATLLASNAANATAHLAAFAVTEGPAYVRTEASAPTHDAQTSPGAGPLLAICVIALAVVLRRRA